MQLKKIFALTPLIVALAGVGCAGGGSNGTPSTGSGTEAPFASGELEGRAAISNPPVTTSSAFSTATALTGSFTSLKLKELNPPLAETRIYFNSYFGQKVNITNCAIDGTDIQRFTNNTSNDFDPYLMPNGKILFSTNRLGGPAQLFMMNPDGTNATQVLSTATDAKDPSCTAAGDKISFISNGQAFIYDVNAKTVNAVTPPAGQGQFKYAALTPDGNVIFYSWDDGTNQYMYRLSFNPPFPPQSIGQTGYPEGMAMSPDGSEVALACSGSPFYIDRFSTTYAADIKVNVPNIASFNGISYSPDQKQFAMSYYPGSQLPYRIATMPIDGGPLNPLTVPLAGSDSPSWGPFTKDRTLIAGGGGLLGTHACGIIYGQQTNRTTSVLAFDATTPSSAVMTAQTPPNGTQPNLIFSIDADNITKLAYANSYAWRGIRAIGSGTTVTSANGALVSLNALDGTVVSVLPFSGTRSIGSRPTITDNGPTRTFSGHFLAVYDKDGQNLAPNGASTVTLDTKSGALSVER